MDIRKADSKGRITGFDPGELYAFNREMGYYSKVSIKNPDGRDIVDAILDDIDTLGGYTVGEHPNLGVQGSG